MSNPVIVIGTYDNRHRAELDYRQIAQNHAEVWHERIYALALVERSDSGKAKVVNHLEPDREAGSIAGVVVGGLLGLLYPPMVLLTAVAGGGIARAATHLWHGVSRKDVAELGEALDAGEGAVLVIAARLPEDVDSVLGQATRVAHRQMSHRHEDIEALLAELRAGHDAPSDAPDASVAES